jgi:hypothetical protein
MMDDSLDCKHTTMLSLANNSNGHLHTALPVLTRVQTRDDYSLFERPYECVAAEVRLLPILLQAAG